MPEPGSEQQINPGAVDSSPTSRKTARSCYGCSSKKIRCDKKEPSCSSCSRAGRNCAYPPIGPRHRRTKKTMMAEMSSRISSLEKSLVEARNEAKSTSILTASPIEIETPNTTPTFQPVANSPSNEGERAGDDILVQKGSSSQYFNEVLLSRVLEERNISSALTPQQSELRPTTASPFNALGIISAPSVSIILASLHPPKHLAVRLWHTYIDNVEACEGLKLLHLPTDEIKVYSTIDDPSSASTENLALAFAVYFASTVSLDDEEANVILGQDKHTVLLRFKVGLEQSFAHNDFLGHPTITGLHALAIYLSALRAHSRSKGLWILNGLAIRIAQSLGLHRDGSHFGLSPFESEIRRRLWWHLLSRDGRAGEDYGLENTSGLLQSSGVRLPLNVDDADLQPDMEKLPEEKEYWTQMTFSLINIDFTRTMQKLASLLTSISGSGSSTTSSTPSEDTRTAIIEDLRQRIEKRLVRCNPVIPSHRLTLLCSRFLLRKLDFVTRLQWLLVQSAPQSDFVSEQNLVDALAILKPRLYMGDELLRQFAWANKAYPQYHVTLYVLWHLCVQPEGPNIESAWTMMDAFFAEEESNQASGSKVAVLAALRAKALAVRNRMGTVPVGSSGRETLPADMPAEMSIHDIELEGGLDEWPNWDALVQGFQLDNADLFCQ